MKEMMDSVDEENEVFEPEPAREHPLLNTNLKKYKVKKKRKLKRLRKIHKNETWD